jgi:short-subunit dehydrogenase
MMTEIKVFEFDFSFAKWNSDTFDLLKKELETLDVGILVNNVGLGYPSAQVLTYCVLLNITSNT